MGHTVGFGRLEREKLSNERLPEDVRIALIQFKQAIRSPKPAEVFENREGLLPPTAVGQVYYKYQVGSARAPTAQFPSDAGNRRLVALVDAGKNILKVYFTGVHYKPGSWWELQYP